MKRLVFLLCLTLSVSMLAATSFAKDENKDAEDNPYGFQMVSEASGKNAAHEAEPYKDGIDMKQINESDTYQAQINTDAAEIRKLERKAARLSKKVNSENNIGREDPARNLKTRRFAGKLTEIINKAKENPKVRKIIEGIGKGRSKFKKWFVALPGIRHWLASPYSMENYKKELNNLNYVEKESRKEHLSKDSAIVQKLRDGRRKFFK